MNMVSFYGDESLSSKALVVIPENLVSKYQANIDRLVNEHDFNMTVNRGDIYLKKYGVTYSKLKDLFNGVEAVEETKQEVVHTPTKKEEPEHGLILESIYSNGDPLLLPLSKGIEKETTKAVCFKGVNGTLIWIPKKAIKKRTDRYSVIASWFKFSDNKVKQYMYDYVCSF